MRCPLSGPRTRSKQRGRCASLQEPRNTTEETSYPQRPEKKTKMAASLGLRRQPGGNRALDLR